MELKVVFLEIVYLDLYSDKVWGFSIFSFCTPPGDIYGRPLLNIKLYCIVDVFLIKLEHGHATCRHLFPPFLCRHAYIIKLLLFHSSFCWVVYNLSIKHDHESRVFDACTLLPLCCYRSVTERQVAWVGENVISHLFFLIVAQRHFQRQIDV